MEDVGMAKSQALAKPEQDDKKESYPAFDLASCIEFSQHIKALGGSRSEVKKSLLAKSVGLAASTPSFFQRIGSSKTFGIIDGWGSYTLTDIGRNYFYPTSEEDKKRAALTMLKTPAGFSFIIQRFDGELLPPVETIGNILDQEVGLTDSWKDRLALLFVKSAQHLGIIDAGGYLRYDAEMHSKSIIDPAEQEMALNSATPSTAGQSGSAQFPQGGQHVTLNIPKQSVWKHREITLQTPEVMTKELWEKLNAYVQILKPEEKKE